MNFTTIVTLFYVYILLNNFIIYLISPILVNINYNNCLVFIIHLLIYYLDMDVLISLSLYYQGLFIIVIAAICLV